MVGFFLRELHLTVVVVHIHWGRGKQLAGTRQWRHRAQEWVRSRFLTNGGSVKNRPLTLSCIAQSRIEVSPSLDP